MSTYPPEGWVVTAGTWGTHITHSTTGGVHGGAYIQFSATDAQAAEIESESFFQVIKSRYYDVSAIIGGAVGTGTIGTFLVMVDWYDDGESLISTSTVSTVALASKHTGGNSAREGAQVQAPSTAVLAKLRLKQNVDTVSSDGYFRIHEASLTLVPAFMRAARITSNQTSISSATWTTVVYNSEVAANAANLNTSTGVVTVAEPGCYQISASAVVLSLGDGKSAALRVYINGATASYNGPETANGATKSIRAGLSCMVQLSAQDTVEIQLYHDHGSALDVSYGTTETWLTMVRVGT